jgi:hypothetical protein
VGKRKIINQENTITIKAGVGCIQPLQRRKLRCSAEMEMPNTKQARRYKFLRVGVR